MLNVEALTVARVDSIKDSEAKLYNAEGDSRYLDVDSKFNLGSDIVVEWFPNIRSIRD